LFLKNYGGDGPFSGLPRLAKEKLEPAGRMVANPGKTFLN